MDKMLKIVVVAITKSIAQLPLDERTWDGANAVMQSVFIEPDLNNTVRMDTLIKEGFRLFKIRSSPDEKLIREVCCMPTRCRCDIDHN